MSDLTAHLEGLLAKLTLAQKVHLVTGQDFWSTTPIDTIGLRSMVVSDGPSGVRGPSWDERSPSLNLPSASALSSSWDVETAHGYGTVSASEARRKGVDVVLGPTINLHRSPLGGRHFEAFSEDPVLTAALAAAYVAGVQESGVGATPKHYIANDFETDRFTADVVVSDRALRELYLLAFERSITESHAWMVMSSYNSINGTTASENELLETPLNSEWGFDGVVVSDWTGVRSLDAARASQDLAMPGPGGAWGDALIAAVESGDIDEADVDRTVLRILLLASRVGALEGFPTAEPVEINGLAFTRRAESEGMVLVANNGILPVTAPPARIAVIGHNAREARSQGGGSATVIPTHVVSPLEGIVSAFPEASVEYAIGAVVQDGVVELPVADLINPVTGERGAHLRFIAPSGEEIFSEDRFATSYVWFGGAAPVAETATVEATTRWTPTTTGTVLLGWSGVGHGRITADGAIVVDETIVAEGTDLGAALLAPPSISGSLAVTAGVPVELSVSFTREAATGELASAMSFAFGIEPDRSDPEALIAEAVELAERSDLVVLVVGTNSKVESEGFDRENLALPGLQDELAARVIAANSRTVVVVNAGSPVEMPWADDAAAVLLAWFGGQEFGNALGDVLTGAEEPGGRLPTTWPVATADVPVLDVTPRDGVVEYSEGIHIGYRAWLKAGATPRYWFGEGFGYTSFETGAATVDDDLVVSVPVTNTGSRAGRHVVQVYASRAASSIDRPVRWLVGFAAVRVEAGATTTVSIPVPRRAFAHWDGAWAYEAGEFALTIGTSAADDAQSAPVVVTI